MPHSVYAVGLLIESNALIMFASPDEYFFNNYFAWLNVAR